MSHSMHYGLSADSLTDLSSSTYGVIVETNALPSTPPLQVNVATLPGANGSHIYGVRMGGRRFSVPVRIEGSSASDLQAKLDALFLLLTPTTDGWFKFYFQTDRLYRGRVVNGLTPTVYSPRMARLALDIMCPDAFAYAASETTQTVTVNSDPEGWNAPASGVVAGIATVSPVWVVKNTSGGTSSALVLTNTTTGEAVGTIAGIANGTWIRFDYARQIIETSVDSGANWSAAMTNRSNSYKNIPSLSPGVANACTLSGLSAGTVVITYRARYM